MSVTFANTGTTTWDSGSNPYLLGSKSPHDNLNWGVNHVPLASGDSIAPGQQKTFTFSITAPLTAGTYTFQWQVYQQGIEYFGAWSDPVQVLVCASGNCSNDSSFVSQSVPAGMLPGSAHTVSITLTNTGSMAWDSGDHPYLLGTKSPQDNTTWGVSHIPLDSGETIAPGAQKTFSFGIIAPLTEGTYTFQFQLFEEGVEYFGAWTDPVDVVVTNGLASGDCLNAHYGHTDTVGLDNGDQRFLCVNNQWYDCGWGYQVAWDINAANLQTAGSWVCMQGASPHWQSSANMSLYIGESVPSSMIAGAQYQVSVTFQNIGTTTWDSSSQPFRLGSQNPIDNTTWGSSRVSLDTGETIAPGEQKTFTFLVTAPATTGTYAFSWEMLQEFVEWFGPSSDSVPVAVSATGGSGACHALPAGVTCAYTSGCNSASGCDSAVNCPPGTTPAL